MSGTESVITSYAEAPTKHVTAAHVTFAYRELGPVGGVPVVFLSHLAANLDSWDPRIVDAIAEIRHVITIDLRGVGASSGTVPGTVQEAADDAYAAITALGHDEVDVFSFSLGGFIAQDMVLDHPELVRRMVLAGTGPRGGRGIDAVARTTFHDILRATASRSDPREFLFFPRDTAGRRAAKAFLARLQERTVDRDRPVSPAAFLTQLRAIRAYGRSRPSDLSGITQPTLIVNGDHDRMVPSILSADLHQRIPDSQLIIYPDSGHGGIFQHGDTFALVAAEFLTP